MPKAGPVQFRSVEEYRTAVVTFREVCALILFSLAKENDLDLKNRIIRNFVARTSMMVGGIMKLWDSDDFQDCWILIRSLLDRLFHLVDIDDNNRYESFNEWSLYEECKSYHVIRSDSSSQIPQPTGSKKARYDMLSKAPPKWERPQPKEVAKRLGKPFLYRCGYDHASTHVHPMANDGEQDFFTVTNLESSRKFPDQRFLLQNSITVGCLIVEESLKRSDFQWRTLIYSFISLLMKHLEDGSNEYKTASGDIAQMASETNLNLCRPISESEKEEGSPRHPGKHRGKGNYAEYGLNGTQVGLRLRNAFLRGHDSQNLQPANNLLTRLSGLVREIRYRFR